MKRAFLLLPALCIAGAAPAAEDPLATLWNLCLASLPPVQPGAIWLSWSFAPEVVAPLALVAVLYAIGLRSRLRGAERARAVREGFAFLTGMALLAVALVSPLCRLAATLAWAHMVQHVVLVALAPPLLVMGRPVRMLAAALGTRWGSLPARAGLPSGTSSGTLASAALYGLAIWLWHTPALYQAALLDEPLHLAMLASVLAASLLFWHSILVARASGGTAALVLLATVIHTGMLGALLAFSAAPWYPLMSGGAALWGLSPLEDQQLAGMIMWVPMGAIYLAGALMVVGRWLTPRSDPDGLESEF